MAVGLGYGQVKSAKNVKHTHLCDVTFVLLGMLYLARRM